MALTRLILLALLLASPAFASTIIVVGEDTPLGQNVWLNIGSPLVQTQEWAGGLTVTVGSSNTVLFCVQLFVNITSATYNTVIDYANTPQLERSAWLLDNYYPTNTVTGAALQLAIWDIMEDNGDGFSNGLVQAISSGTHKTDVTILADAQNYETISVGKVTTLAYWYDNTNISTGAEVQDLMGRTPEPAAIVLMVSGLLLIGLSRLRRRAPR